MAALLRFRDLTLGYDRHPAVHHLDCDIGVGAMVAVVGPNGAGKSTLLKAITGSLRPLSGKIERHNLKPGRDIAYLPQANAVDRSFPLAVIDAVGCGLWHEVGSFFGLGRSGWARAEAALAAVGLTGFEGRSVGALSGGQLQRVLFARLLLQDAPLIVLDEPFNAIDTKTAADLLGVVRRWHGEGRTIIAALHDLDMVRAHFPHTLLLARQMVAYGPTADALHPARLLEARRMIEAFDEDAAPCRADAATRAA